MRSRRPAHEQVAEVARRRLELLSAELAAIRPDPVDPPSPQERGGSGESPEPVAAASPPEAAVATDHPVGRHARRSVGVAAGLAGWLHDRLPATLQGRVQLGASHLSLVAVLVAVALAVTAWWTVRSHDPGDLVPARSPVVAAPSLLVTPESPGSTSSGAAAGGPSASAEVVVDVAGKVRRPGIARLPPGSRVVDAVEAAGGARPGVDLADLNLARLLIDGEQVLVGVPAVPGVAASAAAVPGVPGASAVAMVNLNTADQPTLEMLPGVGPVTAQAILQWRSEHGSFSAVDELLDVSGIGEATLAELAPFVTL